MSDKLNIRITGNPFIDSGIYALNRLVCKNTKIEEMTYDDLKTGIEIISDLYLKEAWNKNMFSIFPNNILTNSAYKDKKDTLYKEELIELLNSVNDHVKDKATCIGCGRRDSIKEHVKRDIPLTGSASFRNYFPYAKQGADYCPLCVLLIQFMPLSLYRSGGKFILLHSDSQKVMRYWNTQTNNNYHKQISTGNYVGCFDEEYKNPVNGIFHIIQDMVFQYYDLDWIVESPSLNFYYFTNYNQGPELELYTFPNKVFHFLSLIKIADVKKWNYIVKRQYVNIKKDEEEEKYKNRKNRIYERLLQGKTIRYYFMDRKNRKSLCSWNLFRIYLKEVESMNDNRIDSIKELGDVLSEYIMEHDKKDVLESIERVESYQKFTNILRKVMKKKVEYGDKNILFTYDDYVNNICPDYKLWRETRDLLLFRLYENLHDWLIENNEKGEENDE